MKRAVVSVAVASVFLINVACHDFAAVDMIDNRYVPSSSDIELSGDIGWSNDGSVPHTATSDDGFFDTGNVAMDSSFSIQLNTAGTYGYHCSNHPKMKGVVSVAPWASEPQVEKGDSVTITWTSEDFLETDDPAAIPAGQDVDVQVKVPGARKYKIWLEDQSGSQVSGPYATTKKGVYRFRARLQDTTSGQASGYSPAVSVEVT